MKKANLLPHLSISSITKVFVFFFLFFFWQQAIAQPCSPLSPLPCEQLQVSLPFSLDFSSPVAGTLSDNNGAGTGFTLVDAYSGSRLAEDGAPSNASVPGYEPAKLTLTGGQLQVVTNKGIASLTNNNQLNALGVKVNSQNKLQVEVSLLNPFNGTGFQQGGIWLGLNDKTYLKLVTYNNKVQLYKEVNDVSGSSDNRITGSITGLNTATLRLRLVVDPATQTAEGFYSVNGGAFQNVGSTYVTPSLSIAGMNLTAATVYTGLFATHRNGTTPVTYTFDDFSVQTTAPPTGQQTTMTVLPVADGYVRDGSSSANLNFGFDSLLVVRGTTSVGNVRNLYLKFPLQQAGNIVSAKLRLYGRNTENATTVTSSVFGVDNDNWSEGGLTWNTAPAALPTALGSFGVNNQSKYHEVDVTAFVKEQFGKDKVASLLIKDVANLGRTLAFNSRDHILNQPQLVLTTSASLPTSNAQLFVENLDKFPSNENFVAARIQIPWTRDNITYNANHDTLRIRLHNKGMAPLIISQLNVSDDRNWRLLSLGGVPYNATTSLPLSIASGSFTDLQVRFLPPDTALRVRLIVDELSITSNDDKQPYKTLGLRGMWQQKGEGFNEPRAQEMINIFGFTSKTGFTVTDPDKGASGKPKGDEVISSYYVRVDPSRPVTVRQMGAYHGCCGPTYLESIRWYPKGSPTTLSTAATHTGAEAQTLLPRRIQASNTPAEGSFNPSGAFGLKVGGKDFTDTLLNPGRKIGIRVWKAIDAKGQVIPNAYIISNDYLGSTATNYDYNDNMYFITNLRPELGPAAASQLTSTPSAVDFGEQLLQSTSTFTLNLQSLGQQYGGGVQDPSLTITAVNIVGENSAEFIASQPGKTVLAAGETTTLNLIFKPVSEGLKIADLLIYYNNAAAPHRVPLYGIGKADGTMVLVPYRIKSGSASNVTVNGRTWVADTPYAFDNLEPYSNAQLSQILATDEDVLYLREQSSNGDKRPFRYQLPLANGNYVVRLHFAEIFWGVPGGNSAGGVGSRVMSIQLENELRLVNLDVAAEVGAATAVIRNLPVTVSDGVLNINFSASVNRPMICAVEVYQFKPGSSLSEVFTRKETLNQSQQVKNVYEKPRIYPNPLHQQFTLELPAAYKSSVNLQLIDMAGRVFELGKSYLAASGGTTFLVDISRYRLKPGLYTLRIRQADGKTDNIKLLVQ